MRLLTMKFFRRLLTCWTCRRGASPQLREPLSSWSDFFSVDVEVILVHISSSYISSSSATLMMERWRGTALLILMTSHLFSSHRVVRLSLLHTLTVCGRLQTMKELVLLVGSMNPMMFFSHVNNEEDCNFAALVHIL